LFLRLQHNDVLIAVGDRSAEQGNAVGTSLQALQYGSVVHYLHTMHIAVLAIDHTQSTFLCEVLGHAGHQCHAFSSDMELLAQLRHEDYDLLTIEPPPAHATDAFVAAIRTGAARDIPVMLLASRGEEDAIAAALNAGMIDYLVKPVRRGELAMRVRVLLRRAYPDRERAETIMFRQYAFDTQDGHVTIAGRPVELTRKEFDLALLFFSNLERPLSRAYIQEKVWGQDMDVPTRTMDTHVSRVRNKLALRPENGFRLVPVYSYGYRLEQIADRTDQTGVSL
jgi:DNA-binding response OmpR family regulator